MTFSPLPSIADCGARIRAGKTTIPELVAQCLAGIAVGNGTLNAMVHVDGDHATREATRLQAALQRGQDLGPLHGIPIVVKDTIDVEGMPTGYGSSAFVTRPAARDATVVARLREAGAIILGKATTWELGCGVGEFQTENPYPEARNPLDPRYFSGGSSSGSAVAVAAGFACGAIGGDTGGSIRCPASACGIVGLKPTFGTLDRAGAYAHSVSLDHLGSFAVDPLGAQTLIEAMAGLPTSAATPGSRSSQIRFGLIEESFSDASAIPSRLPALKERLIERLRSAHMRFTEVSLGSAPSQWRSVMEVVGGYESHRQNAGLLRREAKLSPAVRDWLSRSARLTEDDYRSALAQREELCARLQHCFAGVDILLSPTALHSVPLLDDEPARMQFSTESSLAIFNLSGHPAASIPFGSDDGGLPIGLQLTAKRGDETGLCLAGDQLIRAIDPVASSVQIPSAGNTGEVPVVAA